MKDKKEQDIFRDTWLRYTAFASDFGEALRPFMSRQTYLWSYGIVAAYAVADTMDRGLKAYWSTQQRPPVLTTTAAKRTAARLPIIKVMAAAPAPKVKHLNPVAATVADCLVWHGAASLALPYVVINRTVWATSKLLSRHRGLSPALHHALPTLAGLAMIPLVVPHIDHAVTHWMDTHVRPHLNLSVAQPVGGNKKSGTTANKPGMKMIPASAHA